MCKSQSSLHRICANITKLCFSCFSCSRFVTCFLSYEISFPHPQIGVQLPALSPSRKRCKRTRLIQSPSGRARSASHAVRREPLFNHRAPNRSPFRTTGLRTLQLKNGQLCAWVVELQAIGTVTAVGEKTILLLEQVMQMAGANPQSN